jgi:hypothetical protein
MRLRARKLKEGPGPGEIIVAVTTSAGRREEIIVHRSQMHDNGIEIGEPIHQRNDERLVELPREAVSGTWRVWVLATELD